MESLSRILSRTTVSPDESSRPKPVTCSCGAVVQAVWVQLPRPHWSPRSMCPDCAEEAAERDAAAIADRALEEASDRIRRAINIVAPSPDALKMTFDSYTPRTASQVQAAATVRAHRSVWLHGNPGVGKTHLATAAAIEAASCGESVERHLVADLMARLRREEREDGMDASVERLRSLDLLVLDDLGVERPTPLVLEALYRIIDHRCQYHRRMIVTSNDAPSKIARTIGLRLHSRLVGECEVIKVDGPDGRLVR